MTAITQSGPEGSGGPGLVDDPRKPAFRIGAKALARALDDVTDVAAPAGKSTVPILTMVRLAVADGVLTLAGSDLDQWIIRSLPTDDRAVSDPAWRGTIRPFAVCVPARGLRAIVKQIEPDAMIVVTGPQGGESRVTISAGRSRFRLACLPEADFPMPNASDRGAGFAMEAGALHAVLAQVRHAISSEETRYYLNGVFCHAEGLEQRFAATDGHRLARFAHPAPDGAAAFPAAIIARRTVAVLDGLLAAAAKAGDADKDTRDPALVQVESDVDGRVIRWDMPAADGGDVALIAKTIDGQFPDYDRVIPADPPNVLAVDRAALIAAIGRMAAVCSDKTRVIALDLANGVARLSTSSPELGDATEDLTCRYDGDPIGTAFNADYWRGCLAALGSDRVAMKFHDGAGPVLIGPEGAGDDGCGLVQVLMPVRP